MTRESNCNRALSETGFLALLSDSIQQRPLIIERFSSLLCAIKAAFTELY